MSAALAEFTVDDDNVLPLQVVAENTNDQWSIHRPTELKPGVFADQLYKGIKGRGTIKEKNWMPFVWQDQLFAVHSVMPHRVFRWDAMLETIGVEQHSPGGAALSHCA